MKKIFAMISMLVLALTVVVSSASATSPAEIEPNNYFDKHYDMDFWIYSEPHWLDEEIHWDGSKAKRTYSGDELKLEFEDWTDNDFNDVVFEITANNNLIIVEKVSVNTAAPDPTSLKLTFDEGTFLRVVEEERTYSGQEITLRLWDDVREGEDKIHILIPKPVDGVCAEGTEMIDNACAIAEEDDEPIDENYDLEILDFDATSHHEGNNLHSIYMDTKVESKAGFTDKVIFEYETSDYYSGEVLRSGVGNTMFFYSDDTKTASYSHNSLPPGKYKVKVKIVYENHDIDGEISKINNEGIEVVTIDDEDVDPVELLDIEVLDAHWTLYNYEYYDTRIPGNIEIGDYVITSRIKVSDGNPGSILMHLYEDDVLIESEKWHPTAYGTKTWASMPLNPSEGTHTYRVVADPFNAEEESNENNNEKSTTLIVQGEEESETDLEIKDVFVSKISYSSTKSIKVGAKIGYEDMYGAATIHLFDNGELIQTAVKQFYGEGLQYWYSNAMSPEQGSHEYVVKIDPYDNIEESDEDNNRGSVDYEASSNNDWRNKPRIKLVPVSQRVERGEEAEFELVIVDQHLDDDTKYTYKLSASGPFKNDLPAFIKLESGESKTVKFSMNTKYLTAESSYYNKKEVNLMTYFFTVDVIPENHYSYRNSVRGSVVVYAEVPDLPDLPDDYFKVKLTSGWNLISIPGHFESFKETTCNNRKPVGFVYLDDKEKYVTISEAQKILGGNFNNYMSTHSFWVYSFDKCDIKIKISEDEEDGWRMQDGWNFVPVKTGMQGEKLGEMIPCAKYAYQYKNQKWQKVNLNSVLNKNYLGVGLVVKTTGACELQYDGSGDLIPPDLPDRKPDREYCHNYDGNEVCTYFKYDVKKTFKSSYTKGETIKATFKPYDIDGKVLSNTEGFNIQYYTFDKDDDNRYLMNYVDSNHYNAVFKDGLWIVEFPAPKEEGDYYTTVTLYCSRTEKCENENYAEWKQKFFYEVDDHTTSGGSKYDREEVSA